MRLVKCFPSLLSDPLLVIWLASTFAAFLVHSQCISPVFKSSAGLTRFSIHQLLHCIDGFLITPTTCCVFTFSTWSVLLGLRQYSSCFWLAQVLTQLFPVPPKHHLKDHKWWSCPYDLSSQQIALIHVCLLEKMWSCESIHMLKHTKHCTHKGPIGCNCIKEQDNYNLHILIFNPHILE